MKFITWNCNGGFRNKVSILDKYDADIIIIQECENPDTFNYKNQFFSYLWKGDNKNKGLGVFTRKKINLLDLSWDDGKMQLFLPFKFNENFNLLAVWTKRAFQYKYIGQFWKYLQINKELISSKNIIICGDFNSNVCWDKKSRYWNHSDVLREFDKIGICSLYHHIKREEAGKETEPTLFLHRNLQKPYHIDYAFVTNKLININSFIRIGKPDEYLAYSDHMPLIFEL